MCCTCPTAAQSHAPRMYPPPHMTLTCPTAAQSHKPRSTTSMLLSYLSSPYSHGGGQAGDDDVFLLFFQKQNLAGEDTRGSGSCPAVPRTSHVSSSSYDTHLSGSCPAVPPVPGDFFGGGGGGGGDGGGGEWDSPPPDTLKVAQELQLKVAQEVQQLVEEAGKVHPAQQVPPV
jgi:hypothetical protein